jgi:hypothetical protein
METNFDTLEQIPTELLEEIKSDSINPNELTGNTSTFDAIGQTSNIDYSQINTGAQIGPNPQNLNAGSLITPDIAVEFLNTIVPVVFVLLFKKIHDKTISKKAVQLSREEKETIKPVLQNYLNSINFQVEKPFDALILTVGLIYGMKYIELSNELPNGNFAAKESATGIGQPTATGTIKRDGRGRPKGTTKKAIQ